MMYFFFGWLACLTIVVGSQFLTKKPDVMETWRASKSTTLPRYLSPKKNAEFLPSTRTEEIIKGKENPTIDDILS